MKTTYRVLVLDNSKGNNDDDLDDSEQGDAPDIFSP